MTIFFEYTNNPTSRRLLEFTKSQHSSYCSSLTTVDKMSQKSVVFFFKTRKPMVLQALQERAPAMADPETCSSRKSVSGKSRQSRPCCTDALNRRRSNYTTVTASSAPPKCRMPLCVTSSRRNRRTSHGVLDPAGFESIEMSVRR